MLSGAMQYYRKQPPLLPPPKTSLSALRRNKYRVLSIGLLVGLVSGFLYRWKVGHDIHCLNVGFLEGPLMLAQESQEEWLNKDPLDILGIPDEEIGNLGNSSFLVFTGVMTADVFLNTRAVGVYETWGKHLRGRIAFFSGENSTQPEKYPYMPVVRLRGVDDVYPPQLKAYEMLRYMWEKYGRYFEWFLRADDDVYMRVEKLEEFLQKLDSSIPYYIGQPGRGNPDKKDLLGLGEFDNFCMGGPGVIFSRAMLALIYPHIDRCIKDLNTTEEDVELGLCVRRYLNYQCTWAYEISRTFVHQLNVTDYVGNYTLKRKNMYELTSLHPLKNTPQQYVLDNFYEGELIQKLSLENLKLHRDLYEMSELMSVPLEVDEAIGDTSVLGKPLGLRKFVPRNEDEVLKWDYFTEKAVSSDLYTNPMQKMMSAFKEGLEDVKIGSDVIFDAMHKAGFSVLEGFYNYMRLDPLHGLDIVLNLKIEYPDMKGKGISNYYYQRSFTGLEIRETLNGIDIDEIEDDENSSWFIASKKQQLGDIGEKFVHFILPLAGRLMTFERFIGIFEELCLKKNENVTLTTVLYKTDDFDAYNQTLTILMELQDKYPYTNISAVTRTDSFARGIAIEAGAELIEDDEQGLLLFIDVDMVFDEDTLYRVRSNTLRGSLVYFPIVYNEFDPAVVYNATTSPDHFVVNQDSGYWIQFGFGIASAYKSDLRMGWLLG
uniref:Hexosyltransferase n=1 Tax=Clastoptera arizonana TaxID=38151 RepID=A0A1B6DYF9_9HEMI